MSKSKNEVASDVTTPDRRNFIRGAGAILGAGALAALTPAANALSAPSASAGAFVTSSDLPFHVSSTCFDSSKRRNLYFRK